MRWAAGLLGRHATAPAPTDHITVWLSCPQGSQDAMTTLRLITAAACDIGTRAKHLRSVATQSSGYEFFRSENLWKPKNNCTNIAKSVFQVHLAPPVSPQSHA